MARSAEDDLAVVILTNPQGASPESLLEKVAGYYIPDRLSRMTLVGYSEASSVSDPVLIIHGSNDPLPLERSREWEKTLPGFVVMENAGHYPFVERPQTVFDAITAFACGKAR